MGVWVINMQHYPKIDVSEGINFNKSQNSQESLLSHYCILKVLVINLNHTFAMALYLVVRVFNQMSRTNETRYI